MMINPVTHNKRIMKRIERDRRLQLFTLDVTEATLLLDDDISLTLEVDEDLPDRFYIGKRTSTGDIDDLWAKYSPQLECTEADVRGVIAAIVKRRTYAAHRAEVDATGERCIIWNPRAAEARVSVAMEVADRFASETIERLDKYTRGGSS